MHYVEDNETNVEVMRGILAQRPQIELEVSTLGLDGTGGGPPAAAPTCILLDMQLPDIDGMELLRHLKRDATAARSPCSSSRPTPRRQRIEQALTRARPTTSPSR